MLPWRISSECWWRATRNWALRRAARAWRPGVSGWLHMHPQRCMAALGGRWISRASEAMRCAGSPWIRATASIWHRCARPSPRIGALALRLSWLSVRREPSILALSTIWTRWPAWHAQRNYGFTWMAHAARWLCLRQNWRHDSKALSAPIRWPSIFTNGDRCRTMPALYWFATACCIGKRSPHRSLT